MRHLKPEFIDKDERRSLTQLATADIKQINLYQANRKAVLGNHFHKKTFEFFLILKGAFNLVVGSKHEVVTHGDFFVVEPPERHTLTCISKKGEFLTFLTIPYNKKEPDIFR